MTSFDSTANERARTGPARSRSDRRPRRPGRHPAPGPLPPAAPPADPSPSPRRRPGAGPLLTLVNDVLAGVSGVYVSTRSVMITVIAVVMAIGLALIALFPGKK